MSNIQKGPDLTTTELALVNSLNSLAVSGANEGIYKITATTFGNRTFGSGGGIWGSITGTLSDQTDLQSALNAKASTTAYTLAGVSVLSTDATKSLYTMTSTIPVEFRSSDGNTVLKLSETDEQALFGNGSGTLPSISFASSTDMGLYRLSSTVMSFAIGGSQRMQLTSSGFQSDSSGGARLFSGATNSTTPSLIPRRSASTTGIGSQATDNISLIIAGVENVRLASTILSPAANDLVSLGSTTLGWSDLHLASGGVINWANGNMTITQSTGTLAIEGGNVGIGTSPDTLLHIKKTSGNATLKIENTGNGNESTLEFSRERQTGEDVVGGAIWMSSNTGANDAELWIMAQTSAPGPGQTGPAISLLDQSTGSSNNIKFYNDGNTLMTIRGDGLIGIEGLTASEIVITDASKNLVSAAVATYPSLTELTYVKGVTSAIQTQINTKANTAGALTQFVGNGNWKVWYSDGSGDATELALGAAGTVLTSGGASSAPSFATPSGGIMRTRVSTIFESNASSRFNDSGTSSGTNTFGNDGLDQATTATGNRCAALQFGIAGFGNQADDGNPSFSCYAEIANAPTTAGSAYFGVGSPSVAGTGHTFTADHFGFKVIYAASTQTFSATNADGTTETATALTSLTPGTSVRASAVKTGATNIKYYIDAILVATHTTNLMDSGGTIAKFSISNDNTANDWNMIYGNYTYEQDATA